MNGDGGGILENSAMFVVVASDTFSVPGLFCLTILQGVFSAAFCTSKRLSFAICEHSPLALVTLLGAALFTLIEVVVFICELPSDPLLWCLKM